MTTPATPTGGSDLLGRLPTGHVGAGVAIAPQEAVVAPDLRGQYGNGGAEQQWGGRDAERRCPRTAEGAAEAQPRTGVQPAAGRVDLADRLTGGLERSHAPDYTPGDKRGGPTAVKVNVDG